MTSSPDTVNEEARAFREHGALVVRGAFVDWVERLAAGVERNRLEPSPYGCRYTKSGDPGGFWDDYCNWQRIPEYRDFILDSGVEDPPRSVRARRRSRPGDARSPRDGSGTTLSLRRGRSRRRRPFPTWHSRREIRWTTSVSRSSGGEPACGLATSY